MPYSAPSRLYYFRVTSNEGRIVGTNVQTSTDPEEIWHEGAMTSCELIRETVMRSQNELDLQLEVSDEDGRALFRYSFKAERLQA